MGAEQQGMKTGLAAGSAARPAVEGTLIVFLFVLTGSIAAASLQVALDPQDGRILLVVSVILLAGEIAILARGLRALRKLRATGTLGDQRVSPWSLADFKTAGSIGGTLGVLAGTILWWLTDPGFWPGLLFHAGRYAVWAMVPASMFFCWSLRGWQRRLPPSPPGPFNGLRFVGQAATILVTVLATMLALRDGRQPFQSLAYGNSRYASLLCLVLVGLAFCVDGALRLRDLTAALEHERARLDRNQT